MAVSAETQRLISVSLGKIAQSRGQRGGINLHKNLLVATVLHKARTAYMMESYNYQQNLHRQKLLEQYQLQQHNLACLGQRIDSAPLGESNKGDVGPLARDSNLGHTSTTPKPGEQTRSEVSSSYSGPSPVSHEPMPVQDCKVEIVRGKENSPPLIENLSVFTENVSVTACQGSSHLAAATQLSQEVQLASSSSSSCEQYTCKQGTTTSAGTTCSVLKRRRDNQTTSLHDECPVNKVAKFSYDNNHSPPNSDYSADNKHESHSQSEMAPRAAEHQQISNLVSIFNSGFSGLCVTTSSDLHTTSYQSDFVDISISLTRNISVKAG